ncbi:MAG: hypothetical protein AAFY71_18355 [Bacteroidota bacterium]
MKDNQGNRFPDLSGYKMYDTDKPEIYMNGEKVLFDKKVRLKPISLKKGKAKS